MASPVKIVSVPELGNLPHLRRRGVSLALGVSGRSVVEALMSCPLSSACLSSLLCLLFLTRASSKPSF